MHRSILVKRRNPLFLVQDLSSLLLQFDPLSSGLTVGVVDLIDDFLILGIGPVGEVDLATFGSNVQVIDWVREVGGLAQSPKLVIVVREC